MGKLAPVFPSGSAYGFEVSRNHSCASGAAVVPVNSPPVNVNTPQPFPASLDPRNGPTSVFWLMSHGSWNARVAKSLAALIVVLLAGAVTAVMPWADATAGHRTAKATQRRRFLMLCCLCLFVVR